MRNTKTIILLLCVVLITVACKKSNDNSNPVNTENGKIYGYWNKTIDGFNGVIKIGEDGNLSRILLDGTEEVFGSVSISNDEITIKDSDCGLEKIGKYTFLIVNDKLYFSLISDDCLDRASSLTNDFWSRGK